MGGSGPLQELATLKEYAGVVRPHIVLWVYYEGNDLEDLVHEQEGFWRPYLTEGPFQHLIGKQKVIDRGLAEKISRVHQEIRHPVNEPPIDRVEKFIKAESLRARLRMLLAQRNDAIPEETGPLFQEVLRNARDTVQRWGGRLIFVYLPQYARYADPRSASPDRDRILLLMRQLDVDVIDLHPIFAREPDPLALFPFRRMGHYTVEGNRLVATTILSRLSKTGNFADSATAKTAGPL